MRDLLFVLRQGLHWYGAENIISNDGSLTCRCLSVIDKSWERRYLNVKPGCFSPIRITVWSGFAGWNHIKKKTNLQAWGAHELQKHIFCFASFWDATDHTLIPLCCLCKLRVTGLISILLLGSGWTWSSLVVCVNSDSEDRWVSEAALCGSERDAVTKPTVQTGPYPLYCLYAPSLPGDPHISIIQCSLYCTLNSRQRQQQEMTWGITWWRCNQQVTLLHTFTDNII